MLQTYYPKPSRKLFLPFTYRIVLDGFVRMDICNNLLGCYRLYDLNYSSEIEYIDLLNENVTWNHILDFFAQTFSNGCRYCDIMNLNTELIQSAIQCP